MQRMPVGVARQVTWSLDAIAAVRVLSVELKAKYAAESEAKIANASVFFTGA